MPATPTGDAPEVSDGGDSSTTFPSTEGSTPLKHPPGREPKGATCDETSDDNAVMQRLLRLVQQCHAHGNAAGRKTASASAPSKGQQKERTAASARQKKEQEKMRIALVCINTPLPKCLPNLWHHPSVAVKVACDGAADRIYSYPAAGVDSSGLSTIVGDFDSISPNYLARHKDVAAKARKAAGQKAEDDDVLSHAGCLGIIHDHSQDTTDLEKALDCVGKLAVLDGPTSGDIDGIVIAGQFCGVEGRLDHTFATCNTLYSYAKDVRARATNGNTGKDADAVDLFSKKHVPVVCVSNDSLLACLPSGETTIPLPGLHDRPAARDGFRCGLVPLGFQPGAAGSLEAPVASTTGLRWNLSDSKLQYGGAGSVSCCNQLAEDAGQAPEPEVTVKLSQPALWMQTLDVGE